MEPRDKKLRPQYLIFTAVLVALGLAHVWVNPWLAFDRSAIESGQVWRLVTGHFVHLNPWHTVLNVSGLLLCGYFFADLLDRWRFWIWAASCSVLVGLALFFLDPSLMNYVGLSGILHSLLVLCLLLGWRGNPWLHSIVLLVVAGRLFSEQLPGYNVDYLQSWIEGRVYVNAHLYGALAGVLLWTGLGWAQHRYGRSHADTDR